MRDEFHRALEALTEDLADMCGRASAIMGVSSVALLNGDPATAERVAFELKRLTRLGSAVHDRAYSMLALQAPVARDLRAVVAALYIAADADRMGGLASNVARTARRRHPDRAVPDDIADLFSEMASLAVELADLAQATVRGRDPELACRVCDGDERMNALHRQLFARLMEPQWQHGPTVAADLVLVGRFYERFADHAVEIARRVHFEVTGHQLLRGGDEHQNPSGHPLPR
ncbi:phosphate signaling complex protein PhoU [Mycobacterium sp. ITM-2016-00317]|uniref:phosphate signaling complex protein PhoU n=1 Tax=Mycobacterium sp. ITM-2016-00317 TaxID=2099694 RepID=UPI000D41A8FA|nr:phosphate signaling complex protein PhoU [Mycobacterium sp. ITM-2016-00317]WNG90125.1 phosphate signaling complex protein PhoU [Mycobacterium sp. ITM-2016-00317]